MPHWEELTVAATGLVGKISQHRDVRHVYTLSMFNEAMFPASSQP